MDFFRAQDQARRRSALMILYFVCAVAALIAAIYAVCLFAFASVGEYGETGVWAAAPRDWWNPEILLWSALAVGVIVGGGSAYKMAALRSGGGAVARSLGGRQVTAASDDPLDRRLLNVVEEMAIASGSPAPEVYVLDEEEGINAFAAGHRPQDAAVAVTRGALERFGRDELQGVVAHEFAHILNGDMRLNIRIVGVIFGLFALSVVGRILLHSALRGRMLRGGRGRGGGGAALGVILLGVAVVVIGYIGAVFGRLIQAAISRQREYLADAAAVQFTRNPDGIAGALKRIGGADARGRLKHGSASGMAHLFFANAMSARLGGLLATHPPLPKRIRAIDPTWDGSFATGKASSPEAEEESERKPKGAAGPSGRPASAVAAAALLGGMGQVEPRQIRFAREFLGGLPAPLREAEADPVRAEAIILALLLQREPAVREGQEAAIRRCAREALRKELEAVAPLVEARERWERLPLLEHVLPALRETPRRLLDDFFELLEALVAADRRVSLFEFALERLVRARLLAPAERRGVDGAMPRAKAISLALGAVASLDAEAERDAKVRFAKAAEGLPLGRGLAWRPLPEGDYRQLESALETLARAPLKTKRAFLEACARAITRDDKVAPEEAELFRAIAASLDLPVPPVWAAERRGE